MDTWLLLIGLAGVTFGMVGLLRLAKRRRFEREEQNLLDQLDQLWQHPPQGFYCESCGEVHQLEATVRRHATLPPLPRPPA